MKLQPEHNNRKISLQRFFISYINLVKESN